MKVRIDFFIDDSMAQSCVDFLLYTNKPVTRKLIIETCKRHLHGNGEAFEIQPNFSDINGLEIDIIADKAFYEMSKSVFKKVWLKQ